jgi:hypothetical protein
MEKNTLQQRLEIAKSSFPAGTKIFNMVLGSIGTVQGEPFSYGETLKVFLPVRYGEEIYSDEISSIIPQTARIGRPRK